jgi:hypothetical protein
MTPLWLGGVHGSPRTADPYARRMRERLLRNKDEEGERRRLPGGSHQIHALSCTSHQIHVLLTKHWSWAQALAWDEGAMSIGPWLKEEGRRPSDP